MNETTAAKKTAATKVEEPAKDTRRYEDRTLEELQDLAGERGLVKSGSKEDLIARLRGEPEPADSGRPKVVSDCVVKSNFHVGRAVNGEVCSYHAMHYKADGTPRE